jgi:hypothetical protein
MTTPAARGWEETTTLAKLEARLEHLAPGNVAEFPIATSKEREVAEDGTVTFVWRVDVHVRIPRVTEYDIEGWGPTISTALRRAYLGLNNEPRLRHESAASNARFGVSV